MNIVRLSLMDGLKEARGTAVVIDVFRAFTCEPLMYYAGADRVYLEADPEKCRTMRGDSVLVGEHNEKPLTGFDLTNSPSLILDRGPALFKGRSVIHRTTSGVTGAVEAMQHAGEVLLTSFVNARATADYILHRAPDTVSIVAMGIRSLEKAPEDELCGDYIESLLTGKPYDHVDALSGILAHETAQKFLRGDRDYLPKEDPALCLQRDLFDFALKAEQEGGRIAARRITL